MLNFFSCRLVHSYGEGPYFVQFDLDIDDNEEGGNLFIVEVPTLDTLPNAVFTFLTLVNKNIYTGLEFLSMQSTIHLDSDERKVAELPYAGSALSLVESAASGICTPYSVGFVGANGALKIIMTSDVSKHGSLACFGRITQGRRTISQIQQAARRGNTVSVTDVKIIEMASRPSVSEGEL